MAINWKIKHIFNFPAERPWQQGFCQFGFHGKSGAQYCLNYDEHWLGCLTPDDRFTWTAGAVDKGLSSAHIPFPLKRPNCIDELPDGSLLLSSGGANQILRIWPERQTIEVFIDTGSLGLKDLGNCVYDGQGGIWVNEITGARVWRFNLAGEPLMAIGSGQLGFQPGTAPVGAAEFNWIYDLRIGPDGCPYVLDSKNFCVRRIDPRRGTVTVVAGTGQPGYSGDGGPAIEATLGSKPGEYFDGPYSLSIDEQGNLYIGDSQNHVVRMVDAQTQRISTIAGNHQIVPGKRNAPQESDPLQLNFPLICSMDYFNSCLFVPDWNYDLVVLQKSSPSPT